MVMICLAWTMHGRAAHQEAMVLKFDLQITAQPLDEALKEFARQSGVQVIYFSNLAKGIQSPGVRGRYTVAGAIEALLAGSGLCFRMLNARTVEVRKARATGPRQ
jgi:iron complex outermembrane receptor protein